MRGLQDCAVSRSPLVWLNVVCLDAPLVAICWQWIFAYSFHLSVPPGHRAALFLTAWLIYLADRFGDSLSLVAGQPNSARQQFCLRHQSIWLVSIICVAGLALSLILLAELCQHCDLGTGPRSDSVQAFNRDAVGACEFSPARAPVPLAGGLCRARPAQSWHLAGRAVSRGKRPFVRRAAFCLRVPR